jgi:hypothetical protein
MGDRDRANKNEIEIFVFSVTSNDFPHDMLLLTLASNISIVLARRGYLLVNDAVRDLVSFGIKKFNCLARRQRQRFPLGTEKRATIGGSTMFCSACGAMLQVWRAVSSSSLISRS